MAGLYDQTILDDILNRCDIVEIISSYIPLKRAGRNFKASCPFHNEHTASFMVSPDKQIYHCFGCHAGGNAFHFLMQYDRMTFPEAVETLARKAGVILPQRARTEKHASVEHSSAALYQANKLAQEYYSQVFVSDAGRKAAAYLAKRGLTQETAKIFKLGFAPDSWNGLYSFLRRNNVSEAIMERAGLVLRKQDGDGMYDRFRNRVIFTITDVKQNVIGFGARFIPTGTDADKEQPKYINSPETPVYIKGRQLFGLDVARDAIRQQDQAVVVEGYLDAIMPFQAGIKNVVASLGTALTPDQVRLLKRYTKNIFLVYDGDAAGQNASLRSLDIFIDEDVSVRIAVLPPGHDPDSFIRDRGADAFRGLLASAATIFEYKLRALTAKYDCGTSEGKAAVCAEMLPTIGKFKSSILKSEYVHTLSELLRVSEKVLIEELKNGVARRQVNASAQRLDDAKPAQAKPLNSAEQLLVRIVCNEISMLERITEQLDPQDYEDSRTAMIMDTMKRLVAEGKTVGPHTLMHYLQDTDAANIVRESTFTDEVDNRQREKILSDCIARVKSNKQRRLRGQIQDELRKAQKDGDETKIQHLMERFSQLIKKG